VQMDEEDEIPAGAELFRLTVWNQDAIISEYEGYSASMQSAIREQKDIFKLVSREG
jgi:hypothetical protein